MIVTHNFKPVYDKNTTILILGSFPSVKSREENFYYMNKYNRFWKVLSYLYNKDFEQMTINEKIKTLNDLHIGIYDVIYSCDIEGSKDSSIKNVVPINLKEIIANSRIDHIYLNGNKAYELFKKFFPEYINIAKLLPSTSPANAVKRLDDLISDWKIIK